MGFQPHNVINILGFNAVRGERGRAGLAIQRRGREGGREGSTLAMDLPRGCFVPRLIPPSLPPSLPPSPLSLQPEWFFSYMGAMMAGGLAAGIYVTNGPEACHVRASLPPSLPPSLPFSLPPSLETFVLFPS
jgi:hypothetical protein